MKNPDGSKNAVPLSPRRRKLRATLIVLSSLAVVAAGAGLTLVFLTRPNQYAPGEASADVTSELSLNLPTNAPQPLFTDVTSKTGLGLFRNFRGNRTSQLPEDTGPGLAWGDFDDDGDDDLFLVSAGGSLELPQSELYPCELYENLGGRFEKSTAFPDLRIRGMGCAWGDYDNDGDLDLVVSGYDSLHLFQNSRGSEGRVFVRVESFPNPSGFWTGASWSDFDHDGDLDLYVCGYVKYFAGDGDQQKGSDQLGTFVPFTLNPASYEPGLNMLLRNEGGTFCDVAEEFGVTNPTGRSLGALWHDFDDDGWQDLYVANDISDNAFYRNVGGKFQDISHPAWVADYRSAMGLAAGDYDRDGDDDIFVTHWVAQENALYENHWADFTQKPVADRKLRFTDVNEMHGLGQVSLPFVGWGTEFADLDSDGWLDLPVANGSTIEEQDSNPRALKAQPAFLFWNAQGKTFHDLAPLNRSLSEHTSGRGLAVSDFDNDGDLDIAMAQLGRGVQLLRNDMPQGNRVQIALRGKTPRDDKIFADGARILLHASGIIHRRTVSSASYLSQSTRVLHIGLGNAEKIDRLEVHWLTGATSVFENLPVNQGFSIVQSEAPAPFAFTRPPATEKERVLQFWAKQRSAMNAMKVEKDNGKSIVLFREAIRLDPKHEDSHYYLAQALAAEGRVEDALKELERLQTINPQSHRAFQQWGNLRAIHARHSDDLIAAEKTLQRARSINPEETGVLLILGEVALLRGDFAQAELRLNAVCATNPRSAGGFFLLGYLAYRQGDSAQAAELLQKTRAALGKEWQPPGSTAEGDVKQRQHNETSPLSSFYFDWNGSEDPKIAYQSVGQRLALGQ